MNPYTATPWQWISLRSVTQPLLTAETDHHKFYAPTLVAPMVQKQWSHQSSRTITGYQIQYFLTSIY